MDLVRHPTAPGAPWEFAAAVAGERGIQLFLANRRPNQAGHTRVGLWLACCKVKKPAPLFVFGVRTMEVGFI
jgi:hypothetical protein